MCDRVCKTCGGDDAVAKIAEAMGFRPDVAFVRIRHLEQFIRNGVEHGYIQVPDKGDPARDTIDDIMSR